MALVGEVGGGGGPPRGHTPLSVDICLRVRCQQLGCCSLAGLTLAETARAPSSDTLRAGRQVWLPCASPQATGG